MLEQISIDNYFNGFNTSQISCIDIPIAGLAGSYSNNYYYDYCFFNAYYNNWGNVNYDDFLSLPNRILHNLGLVLKKYTINTSIDLISFIYESIDQKKPILWITNYLKLSYSPHYILESPGYHGTIINGYCKEKNIIMVKETVFGDIEQFKEIIGSHSLINFYLKEYYIKDLWDEINRYYKDVDSPFYNIIYRLEKIDVLPVTDLEFLLNQLIKILDNFETVNIFKNDNLINLVDNFNKVRKEITDPESYFILKRRALYGSLKAFFRNLEIKINDCKHITEIDTLYKLKGKYLDTRTNVISILNAYSLRRKDIDDIERTKLITMIEEKNKEFNDFILHQYKSFQQSKNMVNHALKAQAWADSDINNREASRAIDGKWNTWQTDLWNSNALEKEHWLNIDLKIPKSIRKIIIRHYPEIGYITSDFEIYGSNDDGNWNIIAKVQDNCETVTTHEVIPCTYRYIKLYITKPGEIDFYARIFEFEVWGFNEK